MSTAPSPTTDEAPAPAPPGPPGPAAPPRAAPALLRRPARRPFLLVSAVSGLLYAGSFQAEKYVHAHELTAPRRSPHARERGRKDGERRG